MYWLVNTRGKNALNPLAFEWVQTTQSKLSLAFSQHPRKLWMKSSSVNPSDVKDEDENEDEAPKNIKKQKLLVKTPLDWSRLLDTMSFNLLYDVESWMPLSGALPTTQPTVPEVIAFTRSTKQNRFNSG